MMVLDDIRNNLAIINQIDWDMTPEEAVTLYLEWGNNWTHGKMVKSKDDVSCYFVIYAWDEQPRVILIKRNSDEAVDLDLLEGDGVHGRHDGGGGEVVVVAFDAHDPVGVALAVMTGVGDPASVEGVFRDLLGEGLAGLGVFVDLNQDLCHRILGVGVSEW